MNFCFVKGKSALAPSAADGRGCYSKWALNLLVVRREYAIIYICIYIYIWVVVKNYGLFLGTLNVRCRIIKGDTKRDPNFDKPPI